MTPLPSKFPTPTMKIALGIAVLAALLSVGRFTLISYRQLIHPVDVLNESLVLNTAILLNKGVNIYSQEIYDAPPFNVNIYTPLYFAVVAAIPGFKYSPFITGRSVSLLFMICALCLLIFPYRSGERFLYGLVGIGWLVLFSQYLINGAFTRMDSMALFFSASAVAMLRERSPTMGSVALASFSLFLALMTKQSYIAAPIACFLYLLWRNPSLGIRFGGLFFVLVGVSFYLLNGWSEGGFFWSVFVAPQLQLSLHLFLENLMRIGTPAFNLLVFLSGLACFSLMRLTIEQEKGDPAQECWQGHLSVFYFLINWIWAIVSIARVGSYPNHFIEPLFSSVWLLLTWLDSPRGKRASKGMLFRYGLMILPVIFAWDAFVTRNGIHLILPKLAPPKAYANIRGEMEDLGLPPAPKTLNLVDHRVSLSIGWDLHLNDAFWYTLLWNSQVLSTRSIITAIDQGYYDLIALRKGTEMRFTDSPTPLENIHRKIFERYELKSEKAFDYYVRRPKSHRP